MTPDDRDRAHIGEPPPWPYVSQLHASRALVDWVLAAAIVGVLAFIIWGADLIASWLA